MAKRKRSTVAEIPATTASIPPPPMTNGTGRRASQRGVPKAVVNPDTNDAVLDAPNALRASPDSDVDHAMIPAEHVKPERNTESPLSDVPEEAPEPPKKKAARGGKKAAVKKEAAVKEEPTEDVSTTPKHPKKKPAKDDDAPPLDPEAEGDDEAADPEEIKAASLRPPPVHSSYLPLPWKGRLGYACLCTYLRFSNPPVFSSRTTRIASILEHRHPLTDPSLPEHPVKNRPNKDMPADVARGQKFVEALCLANVHDMLKMILWNDRYGIRFLRLSSEAFPFASHPDYGYKLAPFASEALAEVGALAGKLGHRLTTHPGQFTQLGSPRPSVIDNAFRDLAYHDEMLSLLRLPEQANRDAVMILHMGGVFGDKAATLDRFRANYAKLPPSVKNRLVLENDDVSWSVHDLLPVCEELNIPFVLDFHHHNIIFDPTQLREGTHDIRALFPRIIATWRRKSITPKMHYSEPTPQAITGSQRRKHNPRPATLPPCPDDMDLMIEAKDKEQAVFELMRTFKLPGWDTFHDIVPHVRQDDNKPIKPPKKAKAAPSKKKAKAPLEDEEEEEEEAEASDAPRAPIPEEDIGMGGPEGRVYWPPGMEEWLRPVKRVVNKKKEGDEGASAGPGKLTAAQKKVAVATAKAELGAEMKAKREAAANGEVELKHEPAVNGAAAPIPAIAGKKSKASKAKGPPSAPAPAPAPPPPEPSSKPTPKTKTKTKAPPKPKPKPKPKARAPPTPTLTTPTTSDSEASSSSASDKLAQAELELHEGYQGGQRKRNVKPAAGSRKSGARAAKMGGVSYVESGDEDGG